MGGHPKPKKRKMSGNQDQASNLDYQLPPLRCSSELITLLEQDMAEEIHRTGFKRKLSGHIRWILEKHLTDKSNISEK